MGRSGSTRDLLAIMVGYSTRNSSLRRTARIRDSVAPGSWVVCGGWCLGGGAEGLDPIRLPANGLPTTTTSMAPLAYGVSLGVIGPVRAPPTSLATCFAASFDRDSLVSQ